MLSASTMNRRRLIRHRSYENVRERSIFLVHLHMRRFYLINFQQDCIACGPFGVIVDEMCDISRTEQVSLCLSFIANGVKKEAFVGFYETKTTEGKVLYDLITKAISDLNLDLTNIVGKCFDGAANMSGKEKVLHLLCMYIATDICLSLCLPTGL